MRTLRERRWPVFLLGAVLAMSASIASSLYAADVAEYQALEAKTQAACKKVLPAVVGVAPGGKGGSLGGNEMGSGVIVSGEGLILTAAHVVEKPGTEATVFFADGRTARAVALGADYTNDAGMLKITDPGTYPFVERGHSADIKPGDWCLAAGHPGGVQQGRPAPLRLGRILAVGEGGSMERGLITDAAVISGDSGGPLFDLEGRLIGIHSNIGLAADENRHVPIDIFAGHWDDLKDGKTFGTPQPHRNPLRGQKPAASGPAGSPDLDKFKKMLQDRLARGDPEAGEMAKKGQVSLTPAEIGALMEKWEKEDADKAGASEKPADGASEEPGQSETSKKPPASEDAAKPKPSGNITKSEVDTFTQLLKKRIQQGDAEARGMIKDGRVSVTPDQMKTLVEKWQKEDAAGEPPAADTPAKKAGKKKKGGGTSTTPATPGTSETPATSEAETVKKFTRLLQGRLAAGSEEALDMLNANGEARVDRKDMLKYIDKWEKEGSILAAATGHVWLGAGFDNAADRAVVKAIVPGGSADKAGLKAGDIIARLEDQPITNSEALNQALVGRKPGQNVRLQVERAGEKLDLTLALQTKAVFLTQAEWAQMQKYMKGGGPDKQGRVNVQVTPEEAKALMPLMQKLGQAPPGIGDPQFAKANPTLRQDFKDVPKAVATSLVTVLGKGQPVAFGVVVRRDGYIMTKASELVEPITCRMSGRTLSATVAARDNASDMALLKVDAADLTPVTWAGQASLVPGTWLVSPDARGGLPLLGMVSVASRPIPKVPKIMLPLNQAGMGVTLDVGGSSATVQAVRPGSPAEKAGLEVGDVILSINGKETATREAVITALRPHGRGDAVHLELMRNEQKVKADVTLVSLEALMGPEETAAASPQSDVALRALTQMGGIRLSKRHSDFPTALTHDTALRADQCGGFVLDLKGRVVGFNIARVDRTASYAIPATVVKTLIDKLLSKVKLQAAAAVD